MAEAWNRAARGASRTRKFHSVLGRARYTDSYTDVYSRFHLRSNIACCVREAANVHRPKLTATNCHGIKQSLRQREILFFWMTSLSASARSNRCRHHGAFVSLVAISLDFW